MSSKTHSDHDVPWVGAASEAVEPAVRFGFGSGIKSHGQRARARAKARARARVRRHDYQIALSECPDACSVFSAMLKSFRISEMRDSAT